MTGEIAELERLKRRMDRADLWVIPAIALSGLMNIAISAWNFDAYDVLSTLISLLNFAAAIFAGLLLRRVVLARITRRQMWRALEQTLAELE